MTMQTITGSDHFGSLQWMESSDAGQTWTDLRTVPTLMRQTVSAGLDEGVCDCVPQYHPATRSVLVLGQTMFYRNDRFFHDQPPRHIVYSTYQQGQWSPRQRLVFDDPRGSFIYTNGCGQRVNLDDGRVCFVMTIGAQNLARSVVGVRCTFDGHHLAIERVGREMHHPVGRGLLEPSLVRFRGRFFLTLRAEDGRGYVAASDDGLDFDPKQPWMWTDGQPLDMSTTQQHWLDHSEGLFLVYTRKHESNLNVLRWRAPMFIAQVDLGTLRLIRDTERIVLPLIGDGIHAPDEVALLGNHHTANITPWESWVCDGEVRPKIDFRGDLLLSRIRWSRPNGLLD